ncbi:MAG TPA: hypothetical protein VEW28_09005 [Candidatus Kapabacteria bacterium]|nr:hypothetical protein [Candidatus Kapabacteria bacterium]
MIKRIDNILQPTRMSFVRVFAIVVAFVVLVPTLVFAQASMQRGVRISNSNGNFIALLTGLNTQNFTLTFPPASNPSTTTASLLYGIGNGQLNWTDATGGAANQVLSLQTNGSNLVPTWTDLTTLLNGSFWTLTGNSITSAYNGTTGNFLGTTDAQPLVVATTNTATPQPIEFYTNNTEKMRLSASGNLGINQTNPTQLVEVRNGNLFLSNSGTSDQLQFQGTSAGITSFQAGAQGATNLNYTFPILAPASNSLLFSSGGATSNLTWTNTGTNGQILTIASGIPSWQNVSSVINGQFVQYDVTATQGTSVTRTDNLFNVSYSGASNDANAAGAVITSAGGATNRNATALTLTSSATGTGSSTGLSVTASGGASQTAISATGNVNLLSQSGAASTLSLQNPAGTFSTSFLSGAQTANLTYTLPITAPTAGSLLFSNGGASSALGWTASGTNGQVLTLVGGTPTWQSSGSVAAWLLAGNSGTTAWNGTTGNFLGTSDAQPLVIATTNTTTSQPIEFYTNNTERARFTNTGEFGINVTPTAGRLLHVGGASGDLNIRFNSLSGTNITNALTTTDGFVVADGFGDLTKRAYNVLVTPLSGYFVNYDVSVQQNLSPTRTDWLYNVAYSGTANDANAVGAVITSAGGTSNRSANGLTVTSSATGTGSSTAITATATGGLSQTALAATGNVNILSQGGTASTLSLQNPAGTFSTSFTSGAQLANLNYTLPITAPTAGSLLFSNGGASSALGWTGSGTNGQVLTLVGGTPTWQSASSVAAWLLAGNSGTTAWNGTTGNYLGTSDAQPLVVATVNTTTPQPIEFFTNNTEKMRLTSAGELGIGLTPTAGRLLHVAGTSGTPDIRFASLSGANLATVITSGTDGVVFSDANGDLTKRDISVLNIPLAGSFVKYDVTSTQNNSVTRTDNLFNVSYGAGATDANAAGAVITSAGGATNRSATGLAVTATATGTGNATALTASATGGATNYAALFTGNVGIGQLTPTQALELKNGNLLLSNSGTADQLQFQGTGTGITTFKAGAQGATNINYTLPLTAPLSNGMVLSSTTTGTLSWATVASGGPGTGTATRIAFWNGPVGSLVSTLGDNANLFWDNTNNRLMVGNSTTPNTAVDISKDLATREFNYSTSLSGTNNDVNFDGSNNQTSMIRLAAASAPFTITGIAGGANGKHLTLYNASGQTMSISNQSASSAAANRIIAPNGSFSVVSGGSANFIYSATDSRWICYNLNNGNSWLITGNSGQTDNTNNLLGTLDATPVRFVSGASGPNTRGVLDISGNLLWGANSGTTSFSSGTGRLAFGDQLSTTTLNSVPTITNNVFNLIDANAALRVWRFASNAGNTDPAIDLIGGTNTSQGNIANQWWTISSTGTPGTANSGTNSQGEKLTMRRRSGTTDSEYVSVFAGGNVGIGGDGTGVVTSATDRLDVLQTDTITSSAPTVLAIEHNSSNTPTTNFGSSLAFRGKSTTTNTRDMAKIASIWTTATDASRTSAMTLSTDSSGVVAERVRIAGNGYVGVNTTSPGIRVHINGGYATTSRTDTIITGTNNNVPAGDVSYLRLVGPTGPFTITGFTAGVDGQHLRIIDMTGQDMTIANLSTSSSVGNRIETDVGSDVIVKGTFPILDLTYDGSLGEWMLGTLNANQIIGGIGSILFAYKPAAQTKTNNAVLGNDPDISFSLNPNQIWEIAGGFDITEVTGNNNNGGFTQALTLPAGASMRVFYQSQDNANGNGPQGAGVMNTSGAGYNISIAGGTHTLEIIEGIIIMGSTGGTVNLQWAQTFNSGDGTTLGQDSYLRLTRIK